MDLSPNDKEYLDVSIVMAFFIYEPLNVMKLSGTTISLLRFMADKIKCWVTSTASFDFASTSYPGDVPCILK